MKRKKLIIGAVVLGVIGGAIAAKLLLDKLRDSVFIVEKEDYTY